MTTLEILRGAQERLSSPRYWQKGSYGPNPVTGRMCLVGALKAATPYGGWVDGWEPACALLEECTGGYYVTDFNDRPATTFKDVQRVLACAIAKAEQS